VDGTKKCGRGTQKKSYPICSYSLNYKLRFDFAEILIAPRLTYSECTKISTSAI
jgi:hypothetical protein